MNEIASMIVIPFGIAMPIEGAAGCIIADNPVFIEKLAPSGCMHHDRIAPGESAIRREVDDYRNASFRTTDGKG